MGVKIRKINNINNQKEQYIYEKEMHGIERDIQSRIEEKEWIDI